MKVEIEYDFKFGKQYPFVAGVWVANAYICENSNVSFDDAKSHLVDLLQKTILTCPTIIPEKEVIEL